MLWHLYQPTCYLLKSGGGIVSNHVLYFCKAGCSRILNMTLPRPPSLSHMYPISPIPVSHVSYQSHPCLTCILSVPSLSSIFIVGVLCDTRCGKVDVKVGGQIICNHCHDFTQSILHFGFISCSQFTHLKKCQTMRVLMRYYK